MKRLITLLIVSIIALSSALPVFAESGKVTYSGNAGNFIFEPGGLHSATDLFCDLKDIMPGDTLTQQITVKNDADKEVKVKIYLRSLGAQNDSKEFLSQLGLKVKTSDENEMAYMFDAKASEMAQLSDWVCLGTLYSGGEVNLDVTLNVPVTLDNEFQNKIGYLDWEFMVEEFPVEPEDPKPPQTGDNAHMGLWFALMLSSLTMLIILLFWRKKDKENEENATQR